MLFLGEIETEFENTLACLSGAQMGSNHEKTGGRKSRDTLPLIQSSGRKIRLWTEQFRTKCPAEEILASSFLHQKTVNNVIQANNDKCFHHHKTLNISQPSPTD